MKHGKALVVKFIATLALLYIVLGLMWEMTFGEVLLLTAVLGVAAYLIGDLFILPRTNNMIATLADFGLALLIIYLFADGMTLADNPFMISLIAAITVGVCEMFFHRYMADNIFPDNQTTENQKKRDPRGKNLIYQTEAAEELINIADEKEKRRKQNTHTDEDK